MSDFARPLRESEALEPILRQARGDGHWTVITRHGSTIGGFTRATTITPWGKRRTVTVDGSRFHCRSTDTAIFLIALRFIGAQTIDQQEYIEFIRGARLKRTTDIIA